jgi:branched-chain amino acid transport system permease protein
MMTTIFVGIGNGAAYALVALTYTLTLATTGIFNFAQAQIVMVGTFVAYVCLSEHRWSPLLGLLACVLVGLLLGYGQERLGIRPLEDARGAKSLVTTVGAAVLIEGAAFALFGEDPRTLQFFGGNNAFTLFGGRELPVYVYILAAAVVLTAILHFLTKYTRWGLASRATTSDQGLAALRGINHRRITTVAFAVSGALGGAARLLLASSAPVSYDYGNDLVTFAFVVMNVGGLGSYIGTLFTGLGFGIVEAICDRFLPSGASLIMLFVAFLIVLLVRPSGIVGRKKIRMV